MILRVKNDKKKLFSLKSDQILPISVYEVDSRLMNKFKDPGKMGKLYCNLFTYIFECKAGGLTNF